MRLYERMMDDFVLMERERVPDGEGGSITTWKEGIAIKAALDTGGALGAIADAIKAEKQGNKVTYSVAVNKSVTLEYHDVIKRVSDGRYFRITKPTGDVVSPAMATFDISKAEAESYELTDL